MVTMRTGAGAALGGCLLVLAGCSGAGHPWWYVAGKTNCVQIAKARVNGQVVSVSNCAGLLNDPAADRDSKEGDAD